MLIQIIMLVGTKEQKTVRNKLYFNQRTLEATLLAEVTALTDGVLQISLSAK
jgi:hypothetical protein